MSSANLERVIEEIKALTPDERRQVRELLDSLPDQPTAASPEELLAQRLLAAGIISELPKRLPPPEHLKDFKPVEVTGKPVSETIIEERR